VYGVSSGLLGDVQKLVDAKVGLAWSVAAQGEGLVSCANVQGIPVGLGIDRDAAQPGVTAGTRDPYGDLTTVGDQDFLHDADLPATSATLSSPVSASSHSF